MASSSSDQMPVKECGNNNEKPKVLLTPMENLMVGAVGGSLETFIGMPVITAKFCVQEGRPIPRTISGMYTGTLVQVSNVAPITALQFACNGFFQRMLGANTRQISNPEIIACGAGAGVVSSFLYGPTDLLLIQQQRMNMSLGSCLMHLTRTHGPMVLMRGVPATMAREATYCGAYLGVAPLITQKIREKTGSQNMLLTSIGGSVLAAIGAQVSSHPIDVPKTLIQADVEGKQYPNARSALRQIVAKEGWSGAFTGLNFRVARACIGFSVVNIVRDFYERRKQKQFEHTAVPKPTPHPRRTYVVCEKSVSLHAVSSCSNCEEPKKPVPVLRKRSRVVDDLERHRGSI